MRGTRIEWSDIELTLFDFDLLPKNAQDVMKKIFGFFSGKGKEEEGNEE